MLGLHRLQGLHPWAIVTHYSGLATLVVLGSWAVGSPPNLEAIGEGTMLLLLLGVGVAATLGQGCVTKAFTSGQLARVSVIGLTQVVFALGLDLLFEGPGIHLLTLVGIGLVLATTAWMLASKRERPATPRWEPPPVSVPAGDTIPHRVPRAAAQRAGV
jgi:drug/metabolite transporter (DMT)-like permease